MMKKYNVKVFVESTYLEDHSDPYEGSYLWSYKVIIKNNEIIAKAHNQTELLNDPTAHAEMLAITQASNSINNWRLKDCIMYVTKEPCVMCAGAIVAARIKKIIWSMTDDKCGGMTKFNILSNDNLNHKVIIKSGVLEYESKKMMQDFFSEIRKNKK